MTQSQKARTDVLPSHTAFRPKRDVRGSFFLPLLSFFGGERGRGGGERVVLPEHAS